jgi:acetate kinase
MEGHRAAAVGHRVVHGGLEFTAPVRINDQVIGKLEKLVPLAPLHQPYNLAASFHRTIPDVAQAFALPRSYSDEGIRRYGFHGLSYEYIASMLPQYDAAAAAGRTIIAHLGNGASMCAVKEGKSIASTMGFSAVDGRRDRSRGHHIPYG